MSEEFGTIKKLQAIDLRIDELERKRQASPEKGEYERITRDLQLMQEDVAKKEEKLKQEESRQKKQEGELDVLLSKIEREERRLYNGNITDPRELRSLEQETIHLRKKRDVMETELLEQFETVEAMTSDVTAFQQELDQIRSEREERHRAYQDALKQLEEEVQVLREERSGKFERLTPGTAALYEEIRKDKKGLAAVELKDGICQGCNLELPAEDVDTIMNSTEPSLCPYCGRIIMKEMQG